MSPQRVFVGEEGEGHSMLMDWKQKRCRTNSGESGVRNLEAESIRSGVEYGRACKVENSHRDKTEQCQWYIYSRECLSCTKFFVGLEASGEIETEVLCGQFYVFSVWGKQHSSVCDEGFGQRKQAGQKGENCSSQGATAWVRWPVSSPSCSTRTIQKSLIFNEIFLSFLISGKKSGEWTISRKMTRQKEQEDYAEKTRGEIGTGNKWQPWDSRQEGDIRHPWPPFGALKEREYSLKFLKKCLWCAKVVIWTELTGFHRKILCNI